MLHYGIKLRSINTDWFAEAVADISNGLYKKIELYMVPGTFDAGQMAILGAVPVQLHAPHAGHHFNPIDPANDCEQVWKDDLLPFVNYFQPTHIVMHPEFGKDISILEKRLDYFAYPGIIIENMPKVPGMPGIKEDLFGWSKEELQQIQSLGCKLCLDLGHASKAAVSQGIDYLVYIQDLIETFQPRYFHLCNTDLSTETDRHMNLREGDMDILAIKKLLSSYAVDKDIDIYFEVPKNGKNLENDKKNIMYFKNI